MRLVVQQEIPEDESLRAAWRDLLRRTHCPQIFYAYEWALAVSRAYSETVRPLLFTAYEHDQLVGVAAFAADFSNRQASFLTGTTADYCDFICMEDDRGRFIDEVFEQLETMGMHTVVLANLPADSPTARELKLVSGRRGFSVLVRPAYQCAQVAFKTPDERAAMNTAATHKQVVRRHLKGLAKLGHVEVDHLNDREEIQRCLPEFSRMHVSRFLATGRISNLATKERRTFLGELAQQFSGQGSVVLSRVRVNGRAIAWNFGFRFARSWFWYQPTFDTDFQQYSPGLCLLAKIIEHASQQPDVQVVDLGLGAEDYKDRWSNQSRETLHITASRSSVRYCRDELRYRLAQTVKQSPTVEHWVRSTSSALVTFRQRHPDFRSMARTVGNRIVRSLTDQPEILFFERLASHPSPESKLQIRQMTLDLLGQAAMQYRDDAETLNYLLRSATRIRSRQHQGFVSLDENESIAHFCWVTSFKKFYLSELKREVSAPSPNAELIFDCWTPRSMRGRGFYPATIAQVAEVTRSGSVWIFAAATRQASLHGIRKAGFMEKFSVSLRRTGIRRSAVYSEISAGTMNEAWPAA